MNDLKSSLEPREVRTSGGKSRSQRNDGECRKGHDAIGKDSKATEGTVRRPATHLIKMTAGVRREGGRGNMGEVMMR